MISLMFATLCAARITHLGTQATEIGGELRTTAHEGCRTPAQFGTIPVEPNALGHFLDMLLAQTGIRTMFACLGALDAGFDARSELVVSHDLPPILKNPIEDYAGNAIIAPPQRRIRAPD